MTMRDLVEAALATVYDPCSVQANAPLSLLDMGLITRFEVEPHGIVRVTLRPTSPWCTMVGSLMQGIEDQVKCIAGVTEVVIELDAKTDWSEEALTPKGHAILDGARARSRAAIPVRPKQWQEAGRDV